MSSNRDEQLLHITARYVAELQAGYQPRLSNYLARYPQYAAEIADFVAYYHTLETPGTDDLSTIAPLSATSQAVLARLQKDDNTYSVPLQTPHTLLWLANGQSLTLSQLAHYLNLSPDIASLLEHRRIAPTTIPVALIARLAALSGYSAEHIQTYFAESALENMPITSQQPVQKVAEGQLKYTREHAILPSFKEALATSPQLQPEQKAYWHTILTQEGL